MENLLLEFLRNLNPVEVPLLAVIGALFILYSWSAVYRKIKTPCKDAVCDMIMRTFGQLKDDLDKMSAKLDSVVEELDQSKGSRESLFRLVQEARDSHKECFDRVRGEIRDLIYQIENIKTSVQDIVKDLRDSGRLDLERYKELEASLKSILRILEQLSLCISGYSPRRTMLDD